MPIRKIHDGDTVCAMHITNDEWGPGLKFFSEDADFIQVGTWGYDDGKHLNAHYHNEVPRTVGYTQEVLYIRSGAIRCSIFGLNEQLLGTMEAAEGDILIMLAGGHSYDILADKTQVLEVKNGPYPGADADRTRF